MCNITILNPCDAAAEPNATLARITLPLKSERSSEGSKMVGSNTWENGQWPRRTETTCIQNDPKYIQKYNIYIYMCIYIYYLYLKDGILVMVLKLGHACETVDLT